MKDVERYHRQGGPTAPIRNGLARFRIVAYVDDGMFLEPNIGSGPAQSVAFWEQGAHLLLGGTAIIAKKERCGWAMVARTSSFALSCEPL